MKEHKSSIHFKGIKSTSKAHNEREREYPYTRSDLKSENETEKWETEWNPEGSQKSERVVFSSDHVERAKQIRKFTKEKTGRAMRSDAMPVREAVLNMKSDTSMDKIKELVKLLEEKYGIKCFEIHIHRDEGRWVNKEGRKVHTKTPSVKPKKAVEWQPNYHAHISFDWQNREKEYYYKDVVKGKKVTKTVKVGSNHKLRQIQLSQIQTDVAESLDMERGEMRVNSGRERKEALAYKLEKDEEALEEIAKEINELEAKKPMLSREIEQLESNTKMLKQNTKNLRPASETFAKRVTTSLLKSKKNQKEQLSGLKKKYQDTLREYTIYRGLIKQTDLLEKKLEITKNNLQKPQDLIKAMLKDGYKLPPPRKEIKKQKGKENNKGFSM